MQAPIDFDSTNAAFHHSYHIAPFPLKQNQCTQRGEFHSYLRSAYSIQHNLLSVIMNQSNHRAECECNTDLSCYDRFIDCWLQILNVYNVCAAVLTEVTGAAPMTEMASAVTLTDPVSQWPFTLSETDLCYCPSQTSVQQVSECWLGASHCTLHWSLTSRTVYLL